MTNAAPRIIVALDYARPSDALALAQRLDPRLCGVKVGKELFVAGGPEVVRELVSRRFKVFLDLKFHDIPNTVAQACAAATRLGVWMLNVHASGGLAMMTAAREAVAKVAAETQRARPLLIAVTVLTSLDAKALIEVGFADGPAEQALRLARLAQQAGLDGVVCSAQEARLIRAATSPDFKLVTPGIRAATDAVHDQVRIATPQSAIAAGADFLVIGRAITAAADPLAALSDIQASLPVPA
ncbi:MAG TPA: orotidine-5'-phosphate decarboxylase [Casimicrobiaceae bacterium]|nr:orotidine-5'-phosphate decarboxylase [Casimicrobiaceae bacterium]